MHMGRPQGSPLPPGVTAGAVGLNEGNARSNR
jgi:hypothetical protein